MFTTSIQEHHIRSLIQFSWSKIKELQLSLFTDKMTLYIENDKKCAKKLLELINDFRETAGYKISA